MPEEQQIIEPLAKFHAKISTKGRVAIPKETRSFYEIEYGDIICVIVRKMDFKSKKPIKKAFLIAKLSTSGQFIIPKKLQEELDIQLGELIEIILIKIVKAENIFHDMGIPPQFMKIMSKNGFLILSDDLEKRLMTNFSRLT